VIGKPRNLPSIFSQAGASLPNQAKIGLDWGPACGPQIILKFSQLELKTIARKLEAFFD
jgi:hypothetical protein